MAGESISIPILTPGADAAARNIKQVGTAAAETGAKLDFAALSLKAFNDAATKSAKADATLVQAQKSHVKALGLVGDAYRVLDGKATQTTKLMADQGRKFDDTAKKAVGLADRFSVLAGGGGLAGGGMGALIGVGVALSGQIATLGFGFGGLALAAAGVIRPIEKAAQASGGLQKNLHTLDPEQRAVAKSLLGLEHQYDAFQNSLKPELLTVFNDGFRIAGHLMHDVQPIAAATGKALDQVLLNVDKEFQSGTWQSFFRFMAQQAGPDVQQLGQNFTDLLQVLPPLIQDLHPLGQGLLVVADDATKAVGSITNFYDSFQKNVPVSNEHVGNFLKDLDRDVVSLTDHIPGAKAVNNWLTGVQQALTGTAVPAEKTAAGLQDLNQRLKGTQAYTADLIHPLDAANTGLAKVGPTAKTTSEDLQHLNAQLSTAVTNFLALPGATTNVIGTFKTFVSEAKKNGASLTGVNNASLTLQNTLETGLLPQTQDLITKMVNAKEPAKTIATVFSTLVNPAVHEGALKNHDLRNAIFDMAQEAGYAGPNKIKPLRDWIDHYTTSLSKIPKNVNTHVGLTGTGAGHITFAQQVAGQKASGYLEFHAKGYRVPGYGGGDTYGPIMVERGETIVPKHLTSAVAPLMAANNVPGFATGGLVDDYRSTASVTGPGNPTGGAHWMSGVEGRFGEAVERAFATAAQSGLRKAVAALGSTFGGGHPLSGAGRYSQQALENLWTSVGGPPRLAHLMAAIADAESGGFPNARNPSGASGLWQILGQIIPGNIFNPVVNAENAVAKYLSQGLGAWVTYTSGAYKQYYDQGGLLMPGATLAINRTGRPEQVIPHGRGGGGTGGTVINLNVQVGHGTNPVAAAREIVDLINAGGRAGVKIRASAISKN